VELFAIQLPGRENRILEPPFVRIEPLLETLSEVLAPRLQKPFVFFGHSMGALVAFELARCLRRQGRPEPLALFVSGHRAPQLPNRRPPIHDLPDPLFLEQLRRLKGMAEEILLHPELRQLLMPALRADFAVCDTYAYRPEPPLAASIFAMGGRQDPEVETAELAAWYQHTHSLFTLQTLPGDHFYLHTARAQLLQALRRALTWLSQAEPPPKPHASPSDWAAPENLDPPRPPRRSGVTGTGPVNREET
jgi:medium-chain acyl-[acyl-carrier-protein] hydrolase